MKLFQLTTFLDEKDLQQMREHVMAMAAHAHDAFLVKILDDMLDNVEEIDDELTYSDDTRFNGDTDIHGDS